MIILKNIVIGGLIIILNLIPIVLKKYNLLPITSAISLLLVLISPYIN
jgi:hypothetical protein